ncbi:MAG: hypothetical protein AABM67_10595 [Acidobacteriota bacterium]
MTPGDYLSSPVPLLAERHLQHKSITLAPRLQLVDVERAIAASGFGLEHMIGERAVAFGDALGEEDLKVFFLLTDRRLMGRQHIVSFSNTRKGTFHVNLPEIMQVKWISKTLSADLQVFNGANWIDTTLVKFAKPLGMFLDDLVRIPPPQRVPPPEPLLIQSADDPSGVGAAMARINQPQFAELLQIINRNFQANVLTQQAAADLTARVTLLDRTMTFGRGMREGWWLSPLSAADLGYLFFRMLGQPSGYWPQEGLQTFDFDLATSRGAGKAVASSAVGLAALGLFGVGWVSTPGSKPPSHLRVSLRDTPFSSSFTISGTNNGSWMQPLSDLAPKLLQNILSILTENEPQTIFGRCVYGWDEPPEQLAARSIEEINQKLRDLERQT